MNPFRFPITSLIGGGSFLLFEPMNLILEPTESHGGLYLGNYEAASDIALLKKHNIKAVLTVASDLRLNYPTNENFTHEVISALDMVSYDLSKHFTRCFDFIEKNRPETNVLVHCLAGISRSATIVIMYLMRTNRMSFESAFSFVKKKRKIIFPNPGFVRQLRVFSSQLKNKNPGNVAIDKNRSRSKLKPEEFNNNSQANLRSLSLANVQKKQDPINFKTPQKSYNYYNVNFINNNSEKFGVKPINGSLVIKKPANINITNKNMNPYNQSLSKSNKKELVKSYDKLIPAKMTMTPSPIKVTKKSDLDNNFMFLKKKI